MITPRIVFATTSGSTGKTTSCVATAAVLVERGQRVLVVDTDWQMDASRWLGVDQLELAVDQISTLDVLMDRSRFDAGIVPSATIPGVDLLPATPRLEHWAHFLSGNLAAPRQLGRALDAADDRWDTVLIDCRAGTELPTQVGIIASTALVGVTQAGIKELNNLVSLQERVAQLADAYERPVTLAGILPCNRSVSGDAYNQVMELAEQTFGAERMLPSVRHSVAVVEAHAARKALTSYQRWRGVADDYRAVVDALTERGVLHTKRRRRSA